MAENILVVNTGSTSTKIAVYHGMQERLLTTLQHDITDIQAYEQVIDQYPWRIRIVQEALDKAGIDDETFDAVVGRGGLLKPISGGVWHVTEAMLKDLRDPRTAQHASNLSGIIAWEIASAHGIPALVVDPVVVDELEPVARISGLPELPRKSIFHALNQKASARKAARELGKPYEECNLIIAHLGGGISVGAHRGGRVIDVNNALNGDGPMTPERTGSLPVGDLVSLCYSGAYTEKEMLGKIKGKGGLVAYLGTSNVREAAAKAEEGDSRTRLVLEAMAYQVAKEIASLSAVLKGDIDAIIITGGMANCTLIVDWIIERVSFLGRVLRYPGENEMEALRDGALRVLRGEETPGEYT